MAPSHKFKRALRSAARLPGRVPGVRSSSGRNIFTPQPNEQPLVVLRIQVIGCTGLLARDRNGHSDPFVVVSVLNTRHQTPVAKRTVNPTYEAKDATFDFELYVSLADKLGAVELVVWDKDMVGKDYLGEVAIPLDEWFGDDRPFAFNDPANKPFSINLESTRANTSATGAVELKLGFAAPANAQTELDFGEIYRELVKRSRPSLVSAPPTEGVGTIRSRAGSPELEDDSGLSSDDESDDEAEFVDAPEEASAHPTPLLDHTPPAAPVAVPEEKEKEKKRHPTPSGDSRRWNDILGIVMLEIQRAGDLPRLKNMMHTGWDMDPFAVISFGKKVSGHASFAMLSTQYGTRSCSSTSVGTKRTSTTGFEVRKLIEKAPQKNPETGLYDMEENGEREMIDFKLKLDPGAGNGGIWELRHSPFIYVRAKYQPYDALRQRFWRHYLKQYDTDDTNTISHIELTPCSTPSAPPSPGTPSMGSSPSMGRSPTRRTDRRGGHSDSRRGTRTTR
ncbi:Phosphatidylserine decarboxylase proenzyme 2 [Hypsizygus marmoreus]|uniref:Phosphatidylserine decarboxylase proenzyme 2 n=1 Tax=Hypsizygus marmoreus TaxID=39966 RepID=A0A369JYK5_HYPMA|nr:Phosphatidylserine decarboxylase proenzyme 2 [Hypsizygus marmoreus]